MVSLMCKLVLLHQLCADRFLDCIQIAVSCPESLKLPRKFLSRKHDGVQHISENVGLRDVCGRITQPLADRSLSTKELAWGCTSNP